MPDNPAIDPKSVQDLEKILTRQHAFFWSRDGIDLRPYSTIGIGGKAAGVVIPISEEEIAQTVAFCSERRIPYSIKGAGANSVYGNMGILIDMNGMNKFIQGEQVVDPNDVKPDDGIIIAQAGVQLGRSFGDVTLVKGNHREDFLTTPKRPKVNTPDEFLPHIKESLADVAHMHSLSGVEEMTDVPGTVGGATVMNAAAYYQSIGSIVEEVYLVTPKGDIEIIKREDLQGFFRRSEKLKFDYRYSILQEPKYRDHILYQVKLKFEPGDQEEMKEKMFRRYQQRNEKHPNGLMVGSVFQLRGYDQLDKEGQIDIRADDLIRDAGLAGYTHKNITVYGGYPVIFLNNGNATLDEFTHTLLHVHNTVWDKIGISLRREVKYLPYDLTPEFSAPKK